MIRTDKRLGLCTALLVCNLAFIWGNSLLPGGISGAISDWVKKFLDALIPGEDDSPSGSGLLRKFAHFTEFAALGFLLSWRLGMLQKRRRFAFFWGAAAACVDETIQIFVPDRGPGLKDVAIDCCGVLAGMMVLHLGHTYYKKKTNNTPMEDTK